MFKGALLHQAVTSSVPDTLIDQTVKDNPTGCGAVMVHGGKVLDIFFNQDKGYGVAGVKEFLKTCQKEKIPVWLHFLNHNGAVDRDFQPYKVLNEGEDFMLMLADADFSQFAKTDGSHPDAFYAAHDFFLPEISDLYSRTKNIKAVVSTMNGAANWHMKIKSATANKGRIVFFGSNGEHFGQGTSHDFSWGWTTTPYNYKETEYPEKKGALEATKSMVGALSNILSISKAPHSNVASKPGSNNDTNAAPVQAATAIPANGQTNAQLIENTYEDKYPPVHFTQSRARRTWYKNVLGRPDALIVLEDGETVTKEYKLTENDIMKANKGKGLAVRTPIKKTKTVHSLQDVGSALTQTTPSAAEKQLAAADARRSNKDTTTHNIPPATTPPGVHIIGSQRVMSDKTDKDLATFFARKDVKTMLDMSARKVPYDPKAVMGKSEVKTQTFAESRGLKDTRQLSHLTLGALEEMGKMDLKSLVHLCDDWRALAMQYAPAYEVQVATEKKKSAQEIIAERKLAKQAASK